MSAFPVGLQQKFNVDSFSIAPRDNVINSDVDVGPVKRRSRATKTFDVYACSIDLEMADYATFVTFYRNTLNNGVMPFTFPNPMTGTTDTFRFLGPYSITPIGGRYFRVAMQWELSP